MAELKDVKDRFLRELLELTYADNPERLERFLNPIKTDYEKKFEKNGWIHVDNVVATNYHLGLDLEIEPLRKSLRRVREDYEKRLYRGKRVRLARTHNIYGKRIPYPTKHHFWRVDVAVVGVYVKDVSQNIVPLRFKI